MATKKTANVKAARKSKSGKTAYTAEGKRIRNKSTGRTYDNEYQSAPEQKKKRANRNAARADKMKKGLVKKGDGKDVTHKDGNALNNKKSNTGVQARSKNRSYKRTKTAGKKDPRS